MKRLIIALLLVAGICSVGFAQEDTNEYSSANYNYRTTSGGFWIWEENCNGGAGEFGINLLKKEKNFVFRNCFFVQGEGGSGNLTTDRFVDFGGVERFLVGQPSGALSNFAKCTPSLTIGYRSFK